MNKHYKMQTQDEINDFIKQNAGLLYKNISTDIGSRVDEGGKEKKKTLDGKFTKHLQISGMYKFNGLNTTIDKERNIEGSKDWMLKLV